MLLTNQHVWFRCPTKYLVEISLILENCLYIYPTIDIFQKKILFVI